MNIFGLGFNHHCLHHNDSHVCSLQVMEFYCESCETAMCLECTEGEHCEHVTVPLRDVLEQHKGALKNQLDAIRNRFEQHQGNIQFPKRFKCVVILCILVKCFGM